MIRGIRAIAPAATALVLAALVLSGCATTSGVGTASTPAATATSTPAASATSSAPAVSAIPTAAFDDVLALVVERLATGDTVAAAKYFSGQPVTDEAREKAVLDAAAARAAEVGADTTVVALVFADQISASKEVQQALLDSWAAGTTAPPSTAPDLATEVRPILDRITQELVPALKSAEQYRADPGCAAAVESAATTAIAAAASAASSAALAALPTATAHLCD